MKSRFFTRFRIAALLLTLLASAANSNAQGEAWNSWLPGSKKNDFESQISMARLSERHGQSDTAHKIYEAVLAKEPQHQMAHHRLAVLAAKKGDFATADQHFASAMQAGPASAELMGDAGYCLYLQARSEEAEKMLRQTIQQFPSSKAAHNTLGLVLGQMGRYDEALAEFRQVVGEAEAHANLAFILSQSGQVEEASKHYHQALNIDKGLRSAAEALVQLNDHLPAQSAVFTLNSKASSKAATRGTGQVATTPNSQHAPAASSIGDAATKSAEVNSMANHDASQVKSGDPNNPIPSVAKPVVPQTPKIPTQVQTRFTFGASAFNAPVANQPATKEASTLSQTKIAQNNSTTGDANSTSETPKKASVNLPDVEVKPSYGMRDEQVAAVERIQARVFEIPLPQAMASDEQAEQAQEEPRTFTTPHAAQLAAAKAHADLLSRPSPLDSSQGYSTRSTTHVPSEENVSTTKLNQTSVDVLPVAFITGTKQTSASEESAISSAVEQRSEVANTQVPTDHQAAASKAAGSAVSPPVWQAVMLTTGGILGLLGVGGAFWYLLQRKSVSASMDRSATSSEHSSFASSEPSATNNATSAVEEDTFDMEETYTYLENQIRDVWAGRSQQGGTRFGGASAASYLR